MTRLRKAAAIAVLMIGTSVVHAESAPADLESQVRAAEAAFAQSMADRDHEAFTTFVSEEAVFLGGGVLRGKQAIADGWRSLFEGDTAPFSWKPDTVEVLDSGNLALSTGPVYDAGGEQTDVFTSIWRQEEPGVWRVIFDRGTKYCP